MGRTVYQAKSDSQTKERLGKFVRTLGYTGRLSDFVDVPEQTHKVVSVPLTVSQKKAIQEAKLEWPDPLVLLGKKHQIEQGVLKGDKFNQSGRFDENKTEVLLDLQKEFGKILVFAKYKDQIDHIAKQFAKECTVYTLTGDTKDRKALMEMAEKDDTCIVIAQSSISAGYELPSFRCTVYCSIDFSVVSYIQGLGRTLRINNLQKNLYVYLLCGEIDKKIYESVVINKVDFNEKMYAETRS